MSKARRRAQTCGSAERSKPVIDLRALFRHGRLGALDLHTLPNMAAAATALGPPSSCYAAQLADDGTTAAGSWWIQNWGTLELMHGPAGELLLWHDTFVRKRPWLPGLRQQHGSLLRQGLPLAGIWRRLARARVGSVSLSMHIGHPYSLRLSGASGAYLAFESPDLSDRGHRCVALGWESPALRRPALHQPLATWRFS